MQTVVGIKAIIICKVLDAYASSNHAFTSTLIHVLRVFYYSEVKTQQRNLRTSILIPGSVNHTKVPENQLICASVIETGLQLTCYM